MARAFEKDFLKEDLWLPWDADYRIHIDNHDHSEEVLAIFEYEGKHYGLHFHLPLGEDGVGPWDHYWRNDLIECEEYELRDVVIAQWVKVEHESIKQLELI